MAFTGFHWISKELLPVWVGLESTSGNKVEMATHVETPNHRGSSTGSVRRAGSAWCRAACSGCGRLIGRPAAANHKNRQNIKKKDHQFRVHYATSVFDPRSWMALSMDWDRITNRPQSSVYGSSTSAKSTSVEGNGWMEISTWVSPAFPFLSFKSRRRHCGRARKGEKTTTKQSTIARQIALMSLSSNRNKKKNQRTTANERKRSTIPCAKEPKKKPKMIAAAIKRKRFRQ